MSDEPTAEALAEARKLVDNWELMRPVREGWTTLTDTDLHDLALTLDTRTRAAQRQEVERMPCTCQPWDTCYRCRRLAELEAPHASNR